MIKKNNNNNSTPLLIVIVLVQRHKAVYSNSRRAYKKTQQIKCHKRKHTKSGIKYKSQQATDNLNNARSVKLIDDRNSFFS